MPTRWTGESMNWASLQLKNSEQTAAGRTGSNTCPLLAQLYVNDSERRRGCRAVFPSRPPKCTELAGLRCGLSFGGMRADGCCAVWLTRAGQLGGRHSRFGGRVKPQARARRQPAASRRPATERPRSSAPRPDVLSLQHRSRLNAEPSTTRPAAGDGNSRHRAGDNSFLSSTKATRVHEPLGY